MKVFDKWSQQIVRCIRIIHVTTLILNVLLKEKSHSCCYSDISKPILRRRILMTFNWGKRDREGPQKSAYIVNNVLLGFCKAHHIVS